MSADIRTLRACNPPEADKPQLMSVAALLRNIADSLDAGEYGMREAIAAHGAAAVCRAALVLRVSNQDPQMFGLGPTDSVQTFMDLHAGALQIIHMPGAFRGV